jgi:hypothetical protein
VVVDICVHFRENVLEIKWLFKETYIAWEYVFYKLGEFLDGLIVISF